MPVGVRVKSSEHTFDMNQQVTNKLDGSWLATPHRTVFRFAQLPPHFSPSVDSVAVWRLTKLTFRAFGKTLALVAILEHLLVALLFHKGWMHEALPAVHPLRNIPPWKDTGHLHAKLFVSA